MKQLLTCMVVILSIAQGSDAVLELCKDLKPQNVTLEEFAGSWINVEAYSEFSKISHEEELTQRHLQKSMCETFNVSLAKPNELINETHVTGYTMTKRHRSSETRTRDLSLKMLQLGVFKAVEVVFEGHTAIVIAINENKDYMALASCTEQDWFQSNIPFELITFRSSNSEYNSTMIQEMQE
ncbi:hypothetical protein B566_EDAN003935, partial [Ephemera danica]